MHHNDIKCGEIVDDSCYIPKLFCSLKEDLFLFSFFFLGGGGGEGATLANFGLLVQKFRIWAVMKSNGQKYQ